jgi:hypothetical protein
MPSRAAKFVSAIIANLLASVPLVMTAHGETPAADNCLSAPGSAGPAGSHWNYRIDRATKRHCWYLRGADAQSQPLAQQTTQPAAPQPPQTSQAATAKSSIADAHAELRGRPANDDNASANPPANAAASGTDSTSASVFNPTPTVTTRWPEQAPVSQTPSAAPVATAVAANATAQSPADPAPAEQPQATAEPAGNNYFGSDTILILIAATLGALAFAGVIAMILRKMDRTRGRVTQSARSPIWEMTDDDRIVLSDFQSMDQGSYRPKFARDVHVSDDDHEEEFVARAPRYARG